jgi:1-phosphatidylinositol-4-phosphate 5-kinase
MSCIFVRAFQGDLRGMSSMVSEGKSGNLFYWSHDGRFLVKTIGGDERESLIKMLRSYKNYVASHRDTLLTKYLGVLIKTMLEI